MEGNTNADNFKSFAFFEQILDATCLRFFIEGSESTTELFR